MFDIKKMIVLAMTFISVGLFFNITVFAMPTMTGPAIFASASDIATARVNIASTLEPWKSAWSYSLSQSNAALNANSSCPTWAPTPNLNQFNEQWYPARGAALSAQYLGFAYQMTGNTAYAEKARTILLSWATGWTDPYSDVSNDVGRGIWTARPAANFCYAYSLIYDYLSSSDKTAINTTMAIWMVKIKASQANWLAHDSWYQSYWSNHFSGQNLGIIATGIMIGDTTSVNYAVSSSSNPRNVQKMIQGAIFMSGDTPQDVDPSLTDDAQAVQTGEMWDRYRIVEDNKGFGYATLHLAHLMDTATIMLNNGTDLFNYTAPTGENIKLALENYAEYFIAQDTTLENGFYASTDYGYDSTWGGMFETGHKRYPASSIIEEAVAKGPRTSANSTETYGKTEVLLRGELITKTYPTLTEITINGVPVNGYSPSTYMYTKVLQDGIVTIPTVASTSSYTTVVTQATQLPGFAKIVVSNGSLISNYYVKFDFGQPNHSNLIIPVSSSASTGTSTLITNSNTNTKWQTTGSQWLKYDLGSIKTLDYVAIATTKGQKRLANYTISVSNDDINWTNKYSGTSRGFTWNFEFYKMIGANARYVKINANGYTEGGISYVGNDIAEVDFYNTTSSNACTIVGVTIPVSATIVANTISASATNSTANIYVDVAVSADAIWKLYSDASCTINIENNNMNLAVGANIAYVKVIAQDGTTKIYTLTVIRAGISSTDYGIYLGTTRQIAFSTLAGTYNINVSYKNYDTSSQITKFIVMVRKNNKLTNIYTLDKTFASSETYTFSQPITLRAYIDDPILEIKCMLWNGFALIKAYTNALVFSR